MRAERRRARSAVLLVLVLAVWLVGLRAHCLRAQGSEAQGAESQGLQGGPPLAEATFAGGCFWSMELPFDALQGVVSTTAGYTGGHVPDPTYEEVSRGDTGHVEAVRVEYDPRRVTYVALLDTFWHNVDPLTAGGQFCDVGPQYRSAIFVHDEAQRQLAEASKARLEATGRFAQPLVTAVLPAGPFYPAEAEHQDYARKHPLAYGFYRKECGRDARLRELWGREAVPGRPRPAFDTGVVVGAQPSPQTGSPVWTSMPSASRAKRSIRARSGSRSSSGWRPERSAVSSSRSLQRRSRHTLTPTRRWELTSAVSRPTSLDEPEVWHQSHMREASSPPPFSRRKMMPTGLWLPGVPKTRYTRAPDVSVQAR
jgi:peptide-methionine (S)-S-oxide reductase